MNAKAEKHKIRRVTHSTKHACDTLALPTFIRCSA